MAGRLRFTDNHSYIPVCGVPFILPGALTEVISCPLAQQ